MNKKRTVVIVDDEAPAREVIKHYLRDFPSLEVVAECSNGFDAVKAIQRHRPDLLFLDVQMPKLNGFEMLELLEEPPVIVFSTAYDQYALKAFEVNAADYLLKPFSRERFREALERATQALQNRSAHKRTLAGLVRHLDAGTEFLQRVAVKSGAQIFVIPVQKLTWLEAQDDYVMLHTREDSFLKQKTMKYFETHLDPKEFVRIHRSHIVRISEIQRIEQTGKESYAVVLAGGQTLPVSKRGHARLKAVLDK